MLATRTIHVFINKQKFGLDSPVQTGAHLKHLGNIALSDVLFLQQPGDDIVVANDAKITLKNGDHLHSQPPADYGMDLTAFADSGVSTERMAMHSTPDGWSFLEISGFTLPDGYLPNSVQLLLKLPPTFPDASPDMFWIRPEVKAPGNVLPRATSAEQILGVDWQRFSWHMAAGAWRPGVSTLRDYLRCVTARFLRLD